MKLSRLSEFCHSFWFFFLLALIPPAFWMAGQYPGLFISDVFYALDAAEKGIFTLWHSWPYGLLILFFSKFSYNLLGLAVFQSLVFATTAALLFSLPAKFNCRSLYVFPLFQVFFLIPPVGAFFVSHNRDVWFNWLFMLLFYFFFLMRLNRPRENGYSKASSIGLITVSSLLLAFRMDYLPVALVLPFLLFDFSKSTINLKRWGGYIGAHLVTLFVIPFLLKMPSADPLYKLTVIINPLSYTLRHAPAETVGKIDSSIKEDIEKVITFETLMTVYDDFEIPAFHQGKINKNITPEEFEKLKDAYLKIIFQFPRLFIENRFVLFMEMIRLEGNSNHWVDELFFFSHLPGKELFGLIQKFGLVKKPWVPQFQYLQNQGAWELRSGHYGTAVKIILTSALPGLLMALIGIMLFSRLPTLAWISMMLLLRSSVIFLVAPSAQFKYIYSLYLFMFFAPLFAWVEWKNKSPLQRKEFEG